MKTNYFFWLNWICCRFFAVVFLHVRTTGRENIPATGGFILACNHISYYDPPVIGSCQPREVAFFTKQELFKNPLFARLLRGVNSLPVRRGTVDRKATQLAVQAIERGLALTMFPEGTRSKTNDLLSPKLGIGIIAHQAGCQIVPAYLRGTNRLKDCLLWRTRARVIYGEPISAEWVRSLPGGRESYVQIAQEVMARIQLLKDQVADEN